MTCLKSRTFFQTSIGGNDNAGILHRMRFSNRVSLGHEFIMGAFKRDVNSVRIFLTYGFAFERLP